MHENDYLNYDYKKPSRFIYFSLEGRVRGVQMNEKHYVTSIGSNIYFRPRSQKKINFGDFFIYFKIHFLREFPPRYAQFDRPHFKGNPFKQIILENKIICPLSF